MSILLALGFINHEGRSPDFANELVIKPISNKKDRNNINSKYLYLIKSKNEYVMRYTFDYNNHRYKYYFNINAKPIDNYETSWEISALVKDYSATKTLAIIGYYVKNWIEHNIYNNNSNNFYIWYYISF